MKEYEHLKQLSLHTKNLKGIMNLLHWDQETYMPSNSASSRASQVEVLAGVIHKETTGKRFKTALSKLIDLKSGEVTLNSIKPKQKAALREWRRDYLRATALPDQFVQDFARLTTEGTQLWQQAKKQSNFKLFKPHLSKILTMIRKKADLIGYQDHPYDALIDEYEPEMTQKEISSIFTKLRSPLTKLLKTINGKKEINDQFLWGNFSKKKQMEFNNLLLEGVCFDQTMGRLDLSEHPFSLASHPTDSRITTRIHLPYLMSNIRSVLHEAGHGLYEMGLPVEEFGTPLGDSISLGIHESQSRWWETRIGLSKAYWKYYLPLLKQHFKGKFDKVTLDKFYRAINKVKPSMIRVEADEVTYPLHVILRFELECDLIEGTLKVDEIPEAWNAKMEELFGITPKNDSEGCLQDIHWSMGAFGYFPTYSLGNLFAAQFFQAFEQEHTNWEKRTAKGDLLFIKEWLTDHIHRHGRRYTSKELIKKVSGKKFSADPFIEYITEKYSKIYSLR